MTAVPAMYWQWTDRGVMEPLNPARAAREFVIGERYRLEAHEERSEASHNHYFAAIKEAWSNLPENLVERFMTPDHLRRYALIRTGFRDERTFACSSKAEAVRLAGFIKPMDEYAVVIVKESVVVAYTAKSQSMKAMGKAEFGRSKEAVLTEISRLIGTSVGTLQANTGRAA